MMSHPTLAQEDVLTKILAFLLDIMRFLTKPQRVTRMLAGR